MAFRALRRTVAEIDERHHAPVGTTGDELGEQSDGIDRSASRRGFLTRAAAGGAVAVGASALSVTTFVPRALAQVDDADEEEAEQTGGTTSTSAAPTTAVISGDPPMIEGIDLQLVTFLGSIEIAAVELYASMVSTGKLTPSVTQQAREFKLHHSEHAEALAELAGGAAADVANPRLLAEMTPLVDGATGQFELITLAYNLEESITATYAAALAVLSSWQAAALASRILPVDSQHAVAWSQVLVPDPNEWATQITEWIPNFQSATGAIDFAGYPAS